MKHETQQLYLQILKNELRPAMGCTEPIAVAYAAAKAREVLDCGDILPDHVVVEVSGNIVKNVKSVVVPNTNGLRGIEAAISAGIVAGNAGQLLEVISSVSEAQKAEIATYHRTSSIEVIEFKTDYIFDLKVSVFAGAQSASVHLRNAHTNIIEITKNETVLFSATAEALAPSTQDNEAANAAHAASGSTAQEALNIADIVRFANEVPLADIDEIIGRQVRYTYAIAQEGLRGDWGANIGSILLKTRGDGLQNYAAAVAAAGSDARMSGCELPVVINSGSGNQGLAVSLPVIVYATALTKSHEALYRALVIANLVSIHIKTGIGCLSAYCGATSAGAGCAAGVTYLYGGGQEEIEHTIVNTLAINSGMICDGAKPSCAAKIASAIESGLLGMEMYMHGSEFLSGDGIVTKGVENTIRNVGQLARDGMRQTDQEIIKIMLETPLTL